MKKFALLVNILLKWLYMSKFNLNCTFSLLKQTHYNQYNIKIIFILVKFIFSTAKCIFNLPNFTLRKVKSILSFVLYSV